MLETEVLDTVVEVEDFVVGVTTEVGTVVMATVVIMEVIEDGVGDGGDGDGHITLFIGDGRFTLPIIGDGHITLPTVRDGRITLPRIPILVLQVLDWLNHHNQNSSNLITGITARSHKVITRTSKTVRAVGCR